MYFKIPFVFLIFFKHRYRLQQDRIQKDIFKIVAHRICKISSI